MEWTGFTDEDLRRLKKSSSGKVIGREGHCKRYRAAPGHRARVNADLTPSTGGPVEHACSL